MYLGNVVKDAMHAISSGIQIPVIIVLLIFVIVTIIMLGSLLTEFFTERKRMKVGVSDLIDRLHNKSLDGIKQEIQDSNLLKRQKAALTELIDHSNLSESSLNALARKLISNEELYYEKIVARSDLIARLGPMFGLMATLIPLGPGLIALGQGDTKSLADSLLIAFDATVTGLASAAVCFVISKIRKNWYEDYMTLMDTLMECILEEVKACEHGFKIQPSEIV